MVYKYIYDEDLPTEKEVQTIHEIILRLTGDLNDNKLMKQKKMYQYKYIDNKITDKFKDFLKEDDST